MQAHKDSPITNHFDIAPVYASIKHKQLTPKITQNHILQGSRARHAGKKNTSLWCTLCKNMYVQLICSQVKIKLQALVYNILFPTTTTVDYTISLTAAQIKPKSFESTLNFFLTWSGCIMFTRKKPPVRMKIWISPFHMMPSSLSTSVDYQHSNRVLEETVFLYLHDTDITDNKLFSPKSRKNKPVTERHYVIRSGGP